MRADPGRGRRGDHRRRHLTGLRAGGLRPRRRSGVELRRPDRRRPSERLRASRAQHRQVAGNAERASGLRADAVDEHASRRAAAVRRRRRSRSQPAVHGRGLRPAHASGSHRRAARRELGPLDAPLRRGVERGGDACAVPGAPLHGLPADRPPDRGARRADAGGNEPRARRDGRQAPPHDRDGALAFRRREGRGERGHGRGRPGALPRRARAGLERRHRSSEQHVVHGQHGRGQRTDPAGDRHEQRHRRDGAVQPRELRHRPRVRSSLAEPPGRLGARASPTPVRRAATSPTTASRSPRTRRRAPGSRTTCATATRGTRAPSPSPTSGAASGPSTCARTGRRSSRR